MCGVGIRVFEKLSILVFIVSQSKFLELTHKVREVVIRTMRVARVSDLTSILDFAQLWNCVQLQNQAKETDWHEQEPNKTSHLVEPHMLWQMGFRIATHA